MGAAGAGAFCWVVCRFTLSRTVEDALPLRVARIASVIEVTIMTQTPGRFGAHTHTKAVTINARADKDELWLEAARLQRTLDGCRGTNGDINEYFNLLATFAD